MFPSPFARLFGIKSASFVTANHTVNSRGKLPKNGIVIKKLSFVLPQVESLIFAYCGAILALPEGTLLWLQRCDFRTVKNPFPLTTAAQNIPVFLRKPPLCRSHFFEWLKTAISSNACGTSTLKSPLLRAFFTPHVHQRLRKHLSRCTLDCGFKTSESPALRGFEAERGPITGTSLYLVLKSNGPHCSKNLPVKFDFSSKTVPVNIAKKLPSQRCSKPLFIASFNFSHKRPTFAFTGESGYTLAFANRIARSVSHGETGGVSVGGAITTLGAFRTFTNIPGPGIRTAYFAAFGPWSGVLSKNTESLRNSDALMRVAVPKASRPRWAT